MNSFSEKIPVSKEKELKSKLEDAGYIFKDFAHSYWRASGKNAVATFYKSGKLLVQGKGTRDFVMKYIKENEQLSLEIAPPKAKSSNSNNINHNFSSWIGIDESGKGDYFGPLVIAGVMVDKTNIQKLSDLGIKDSKKMQDKTMTKLAVEIKKIAIHSVVIIMPEKYNQIYAKIGNLNKLLAWGHARTIENVLEKKDCKNAISDKFGKEELIKNALMDKGKNINLIQQTKAESDIAVAAASILARAEFVKRIRELSIEYDVELPKGASNEVVKQAKNFAQKHGKKNLKDVSKLHFKTTQQI